MSEDLQQTMYAISQAAYAKVQQEGQNAQTEGAQGQNAGSENANSNSNNNNDDVIDAEFTKTKLNHNDKICISFLEMQIFNA